MNCMGFRKKLTSKILTICISLTCKQLLEKKTLNGKYFPQSRFCAVEYTYRYIAKPSFLMPCHAHNYAGITSASLDATI